MGSREWAKSCSNFQELNQQLYPLHVGHTLKLLCPLWALNSATYSAVFLFYWRIGVYFLTYFPFFWYMFCCVGSMYYNSSADA